jgi:hypothetical protein
MTRRHTLYRIATFLNNELNHLGRTNFNDQRSTAPSTLINKNAENYLGIFIV